MKLEKLIEGGWEIVGQYGGCVIYRKQDERILYNPNTEEIVMKYDFNDTDSKQNASEDENA